MLNLFDIEAVAREQMGPESQGWACVPPDALPHHGTPPQRGRRRYYSSGADDEVTMRENHRAFQRIWFRPRILVNVRDVDLSTSIMGHRSTFPVYITACALGKLVRPRIIPSPLGSTR